LEVIIQAEQRAVAARASAAALKQSAAVCVGVTSGCVINSSVLENADNVKDNAKGNINESEKENEEQKKCFDSSTLSHSLAQKTILVKDINPSNALTASKLLEENGGSLRQKRPLGEMQMNGQDSVYQSQDRAPKVPRLHSGISGPGSRSGSGMVSGLGGGTGAGTGTGSGSGSGSGTGSGTTGADLSGGSRYSNCSQSNPSLTPPDLPSEDVGQRSESSMSRSAHSDDKNVTKATGSIGRGIRCERLVALDVIDDLYNRIKSVICFPAQDMR
jgi:hypothetical protein